MEEPPKILDYATPKPLPGPPILRLAWGVISALSLIGFSAILAFITISEWQFSWRSNVYPISLWMVGLYLLISASFMLSGIARMMTTIRDLRGIPRGRKWWERLSGIFDSRA